MENECIEAVGQAQDLGVTASLRYCLLNFTEDDRVSRLDLPLSQFPQSHCLKVNLILNRGLLQAMLKIILISSCTDLGSFVLVPGFTVSFVTASSSS